MRTLVRELLLAAGMITILVLAMWAHTGSMPPLVVVESSSMVHDESGEIGSIDAGDLVLVHSPNNRDITTYAEATNSKSIHDFRIRVSVRSWTAVFFYLFLAYTKKWDPKIFAAFGGDFLP